MPDAPDGFRYRIESDRHALSDMAELAVRLGSVVSYHRSGTVIFADGMEYGTAPYIEQKSGLAAAIEVVTTPTFHGGLAVKLTGGSNSTNTAGLLKRINPLTLGKVGLEVTFSFASENDYFTAHIQRNDGTYRTTWAFKIWLQTSLITVYPTGVGNVTVAEFDFDTTEGRQFYAAKLVVDLITLKFDKLYLNDEVIDLSAYQQGLTSDNSVPRLEFLVSQVSREGENDIAYIDNFIITTDEP